MKRTNTLLAALGLAAAFTVCSVVAASPARDGGTKSDKPASADKGDKKSEKKSAAAAGATVGQKAPDFQFKDLSGASHSLSEFAGKTVVLEWTNPGCPVCREKFESGAVTKMMAAAKKADPNTVFIFINSTNPGAGGSADATAKYLKDNKVEAMAFFEADGTVGKMYGAKTTPHCFVIDPKGVLAYAGAIDDAKDGNKGVNYVVAAVEAVKSGKAPAVASSKPYGCSVKYGK
ncbi:MAG: redoxin domain-containing protein [Phycisphaerales bacterium]